MVGYLQDYYLLFATGMVLSNYENAIINLMSGASYIVIVLIELGVALFFLSKNSQDE